MGPWGWISGAFCRRGWFYGTGERGRSSEEADAIVIDAGGRDNVSMSTAHSIFWLFHHVEVQCLD